MPSGPAGLLLLLGMGRVLEPLPATEEGASSASAAVVPNMVGGHPVVANLEEAFANATPLQLLERRRWVRHRVRPRERVTQIAARYGVRLDDLREWNELDPQEEFPPGRLRSLRVRTKRVPPPRHKVYYHPVVDEGWGDIAAKFRVEQPDLRAWNWRYRRPRPDANIIVWVDPGIPWTIHEDGGPAEPSSFDVPLGGESIGRPHRGKLHNGVQLPESTLYTRGYPGSLYGSSHTVEQLQRAFATFRHDTGFEGEVIVGSMSRRRGRKFSPHISHQSGRDVDVRLPQLPGIPHTDRPNPDEVDWYATWGLVRAFVETQEVSVIFLDVHLQRRLYEAARVMGESHESLKEVITWPSWKGKKRPLVRHFRGHDAHIHVRVDCGPIEPRCKER